MPVALVAHEPVALPAIRWRPAFVFAAQIAVIVAVAALSIALARSPTSPVAGSALELVAGP